MNATQLSATEKTAILMLALGEDIAAEIFRHMEANDVKKVGAALSRVGRVNQDTMDIVLNEFHQILKSNEPDLFKGGFGFARNALEKAFGNSDFGQDIIRDLAHANPTMPAVELADAQTLYRVIANEHPQTIALVLAHAGPAKAGSIVKLLPEALKVEVIQRVTRMDKVAPEIIEEINDMIRDEVERMGFSSRKIGGPEKAAAILNAMDDTRNDILDRLDERDPDLSEDIRSHMFTFADLSKLDNRSMQGLFKAVDRSVWELALRDANQELLDLVFSNLSSRAADNLKDDMDARGPQKLSDVRDAQKTIVAKALAMAESGEIEVGMDEQKVV
ncbi:flagellar motor switch protein FliG [Pseudobacteriovorax antillogorgiicola]|uniref:Flagellar motor switch protein FliG n=1 Tax=Pseudobacteriovorax antillogorgiicola TaxID=1513793 RepID=A0A1Y6C6L9_9BACT|nr:flagellar motor switch protein FliG [Pseudobacteriovorax antillogorgiicola]TCS49330.1 flagellar motor switch protein FliG [Pseudobacteriovorax antillogorgiicola]SMF48003.1 flagellar motor switch protein FliG [Pseudobacteriovorax antillogorgiicola]